MGLELAWEQQTLAGFEHGLSPEIVDRFDLVVFDHPFCGDIARAGLMLPIDDRVAGLRDRDFVGGSLDSYRYAGHLWALPVDGCSQAACYRPDLIGDRPLPRRWGEALALGRELRASGRWLGLATGAPHGVLVLMALCANLGKPLSLDPWSTPFDAATFAQAAELLREAAALAHPGGRAMNAIELHDAMVATDDIAYCPAAYTYLTYAEADQRRPLRFAGFPGPDGSVRGTVLGGTGLGVTRSCRDHQAAFALLEMLATAQCQLDLVMCHHGQPARTEAWSGALPDTAFSGAHARLRATVEAAWTRPRFPGYIGWQARAGSAVEQMLGGGISVHATGQKLAALWRECAPPLSATAIA